MATAAPSAQPERAIEPEVEPIGEPNGIIELKGTAQSRAIAATDFSLWEGLYGRKLSETDKIEIVTRLGGFFKLLLLADKM